MAEESDFKCLKCATCCRNILENRNGIIRGLPLTVHERILFPDEIVAPKLGVGSSEPEEIVLYQLNVTCCPHLTKQNECRIYAKRPLMCQSFPIVAGAISNRCKVFSYRKPGVKYNELYPMTGQVEASDKFNKYIQNRIRKFKKKNTKIWECNLATRIWILTKNPDI